MSKATIITIDEVLELVDVIEEQQYLMGLLLELYPAQTQAVRDEFTASLKRIEEKLKQTKKRLGR